jgi:hypothetical protein
MSLPGSHSIFNGKKINPIKKGCLPGESKTSEIIACLNALLFWRVTLVDGGQSGKVTLDDKGAVLELPRGGSAAGAAGLYAAGVYSTAVDYIPGAIVYTSPDSSTRYLWICEIANGPSSALQAPTWTEPGTVYWRCYARGGTGGGGIRCTITSLYNLDYFLATPVIGGSAINVAKSIPSRGGVADDNHRTVSGETQVIIPPFTAGDTIWADIVDSTDVTVSGAALTHIEKNTERGWCHQCSTATVSGVLVLTP